MRKLNYLLSGLIFFVLLLGCSSTTASTTTLADRIVGNYIGIYQSPAGLANDYEIVVTEINDTQVRIAPTAGGTSATFEADLESEENGNVTSIILKAPGDVIENNGTFVESTGRLSYTFHLGGNDDSNLEIFVGDKQ